MQSYRVLPTDETAAGILADATGLGLTAAQVLLFRGIRDPLEARAFLDAPLSGLSSPTLMADRLIAADRLAHAIRTRERVVVFGDYDVDGITSATILSQVVTAMGGEVRILVADRFHGGYGLSEQAAERCMAERPGLLVVCDCGSSDHARLEKIAAQGVDTIVIDHHMVPDDVLPAFAYINPHRRDCGFRDKGLCSAGLVFSLSAALRTVLRTELDLRAWLDLVAVGTIADVAPLTGDNRRLVRAGLKAFRSTSHRPAFAALRKALRIPSAAQLTARDIAFLVAPRINAPGRLGVADLSLRFLMSTTAKEATRLLGDLETQNEKRKAIARQMTQEGELLAREIYGDAPVGGVVVAHETWHRGVVGIVAARLADTFGVPVAAIALKNGVGHGSVRGPSDVDVYGSLQDCRSHLCAFGGHRSAAGLTVKASSVDAFRDAFCEATQGSLPSESCTPRVDVALGGPFEVPSVDDLRRLGPFGHGHAAPLFVLDAHVVEARGVGKGGVHAKLKLRVGRDSVRAFAPAMFSQIQGGEQLRLLGEFQPDHWNGDNSVEFLVRDVVN